MSDVKLILIEARQKISEGWTQRAYARMSNEVDDGGKVSPESLLATCWCTTGAVWAVIPRGTSSRSSFNKIKEVMGWESTDDIINWNDAPTRTQEEVLDLFDRAIAAC